MKKKFVNFIFVTALIAALMAGCTDSSNSGSSKHSYTRSSSSSESYDYDKGYGYSSPKKGESFGDYVKRQDPDLYNDIQNNLQDAWNSRG